MNKKKPQILLTNDDGIKSPGLWAAAAALSPLGYVHVAAPRDQSSGAGRSLPSTSDGIISTEQMTVNEKVWTVHSVGGTPAQAVLHAVLEIMPERPHLVVSGINYGENVGSGVTISGTVGAALEAAALGIPSLAVSLETEVGDHRSYSTQVDFSSAAHFAVYFARRLLEQPTPPDVHVLNVNVPCDVGPETAWQITRVSLQSYFEPVPAERKSWSEPGPVGYRFAEPFKQDTPDSDVYVLRVKRMVSVTPLSLDLTSRVDFDQLDRLIRNAGKT
jgi:5'/3'-nucleotidase